MRDFREQNYYELLDIKPYASQKEVEEAYQRARRYFSPDSVATYALFQVEELRLLRSRIEEAFRVLGDIEKRRQYDEEASHFGDGQTQEPKKPKQLTLSEEADIEKEESLPEKEKEEPATEEEEEEPAKEKEKEEPATEKEKEEPATEEEEEEPAKEKEKEGPAT
ncbi:MAG: DnaJ domain-containing protein, partial [Deltaproteobacteria bacterium]|nr:DnaJ domain-containing protein [Deltaproteobacteria bacterium]